VKMLLIVFRDSLGEDIRRVLKDLKITAFTEAPKVLGVGEAGAALDSLDSPGFNSMIFAAVEEDQAQRVGEGLQAFREQLAKRQHGAKIPLRVFVLPCERLV